MHRRTTTFLCLALALLLVAWPAMAAPASAPDDRTDLMVTARHWLGGMLDSVLAALGLTGTETSTGDEPVLDPTPVTDSPESIETTPDEPPKKDDEGGHWDPNGAS